MAATARDLFKIVRKGIDVRGIDAHVRKPFRFLLAGDPDLVAELRALLLAGHPGDAIPFDAAATLETVSPSAPLLGATGDVRAALFLTRPGGDAAVAAALATLKIPVLTIVVDPGAPPSGASEAPKGGTVATYTVADLSRGALRPRIFPHLVECARGVEIAVGRRLPVLRETVAVRLTRHAAGNALKVALASAVVDHVPVVGLVLGAFASAGDMVAITGIQVMLMLHIEAAYGRDPDARGVWQLLPVIGGGFGWRTLARELVGFVPVAGIPIKGAIAYAGTIVVGEGVTFYFEHGRHMTKDHAAHIYERTKADAARLARDAIAKLRFR